MSWYDKSKVEKPIIVIFNNHNEVFESVSVASLSLDVPETLIFNAIRKDETKSKPNYRIPLKRGCEV